MAFLTKLATSSKLRAMVEHKALPAPVVAAYMIFFAMAVGLYLLVAETDFISAIFTLAEMFQLLAMLLLAAQVLSSDDVSCISARAVGLEAFGLACKLSSTTWLHGYLPVDESGDWFYQCVEICSLVTAFFILHQVLVEKRNTYQRDEDTFPVFVIVIAAVIFAALFHANMNSRPIFDTLWMTGLNICATTALPQLWLIMRTGGQVGPLMAHNIAALAFGRVLSGAFLWLAQEDITCDWWVEGWNHAVYAIFGAHLLHLLILGDFAYVYVKTVAKQGLQCTLELESFMSFV